MVLRLLTGRQLADEVADRDRARQAGDGALADELRRLFERLADDLAGVVDHLLGVLDAHLAERRGHWIAAALVDVCFRRHDSLPNVCAAGVRCATRAAPRPYRRKLATGLWAGHPGRALDRG